MKLMENHGLSWKSMIEKCVQFELATEAFCSPLIKSERDAVRSPFFHVFRIQCFCYIMFDHLCPYTFT